MEQTALDRLNTAKRVLLLQGPVGPFFADLQRQLIAKGKYCKKMNFNGGDQFYSLSDKNLSINYTGSPENFNTFLQSTLAAQAIDTVICFGDCRFYHRLTKQICQDLGLSFLVFEEGYIRPDYITFEVFGVNDHSPLNTINLDQHAQAVDENVEENTDNNPSVESTHKPPFGASFYAFIYYCFLFLWQLKYPLYLHHRDRTPLEELSANLLSIGRRLTNSASDKSRLHKLHQREVPYFLVALQVHIDSQIKFHSKYASIEDFIEEVIASFAKYGNETDTLLFKHHPLDRGYRNYADTLKQLGRKYDVSHRLVYVCDINLPQAIRKSKGIVTINSTTGLQALWHQKPVITMGQAIYNRHGLTHSAGLDTFWLTARAPDDNRYQGFRQLVIRNCLQNGSFYGKSPWFDLIE